MVAAAASSTVDAEIIAAGEKFQALFEKFMPIWLDHARLSREAQAAADTKFGSDYHSDAWCKPFSATSPASLFFFEELKRNGADKASDAEQALFDQMYPIAEQIRDIEVSSLAGLRAKTLVAIWETRPGSSDHDGVLDFETRDHHSMVVAAVKLTGLEDLFGWFVEGIEKDAILPLRFAPYSR